ncbi:MAG: tetratricopeptide repeat protein [Pseudohongiellaceae bacterium]
MQKSSSPLAGLIALLLVSGQLAAQLDPHLEQAIDLYLGTSGTVNDPLAREHLEQAQLNGDALSVMWLARVYSTGRMTYPADKSRAREIANSIITAVEARAESGEAEAEFLMGTAFAEGLGKPVDPEQAVAWYRRAAGQGHILAQHNLGNVSFSGNGVPQSDERAVYWWTLAAEQGDAIPQFRLGQMYEQGRGVEQDLEQAIAWYQDSARRGNSNARAALARLRP